MRKLKAILAFSAINLLIAAAPAAAGWDDDICREGKEIVACCPSCSFSCNCTMG